jgi:hypothetical protein
MSVADSEDAQDIGMDDLQLSGLKRTQTATNHDDSKRSENKDDNDSKDSDNEEGLCYPDQISFPPKGTSQSTSHTKLPDSVVPHHFSAFAQNLHPSKVGPHQTSSARKSATPNSPMKASTRVGSQLASGGSLEDKILKALDPASREEQDNQNNMVRFYLLQLRDANKKINRLCDKILQLQSGNQQKVTNIQGKIEKNTELRIENQALKSRLELMRVPPCMFSAHQGFHSQPPTFSTASMLFCAGSTSTDVPQGTSLANFDPTLSNI